ncbi:MAG: Abi family protein [Proteiniphilum sp.]|nr:Abi family protein [Proteiniphilum sp.]
MDRKSFEKIFSEKRTEKYFKRHAEPEKAMLHYQCNIELAETFYPCITTFEVALRNAVGRELAALFGREEKNASEKKSRHR